MLESQHFVFRDGVKLNEEPVASGETFRASEPGTYTASGVNWFGLESAQGPAAVLTTPGEIRIAVVISLWGNGKWAANPQQGLRVRYSQVDSIP